MVRKSWIVIGLVLLLAFGVALSAGAQGKGGKLGIVFNLWDLLSPEGVASSDGLSAGVGMKYWLGDKMALRGLVDAYEDTGEERCLEAARRLARYFEAVAPHWRTAFFICSAKTGCCSVVLVPIARIALACVMSAMELVIAPLPKACTRPVTVLLCQSRAQ